MQLIARCLILPLPRLGRQEEVPAMLWHPGPNALLGIPIAGCRINMVHTKAKQNFERAIGVGLRDRAQGGRAKDGARAVMSSASKGCCGNHFLSPSPSPCLCYRRL